MWPLISNCIRKTSPIWNVSTHMSGVSEEINEKMFIFRGNLGMWPCILIVLGKKWTPVLKVSAHISGVSEEINEKIFNFNAM